MNRTEEQVLALAAVFQAAQLVHNIASSGRYDEDDLRLCLQGIMNTDPDSVQDVFGPPDTLRTGLQALVNQLGTTANQRQVEIARYVIAMLHLQGKLNKNPAMLEQIANGIERVRAQLEHYDLTHTNVLANLAGIYSDTISSLTPKIMVNGEERYLSNPDHVSRIRALLLAGIRAGVLWRQLGGRRWQILFKRKRLIDTAQQLLAK
ncbi:MAG: high frequency lysogenization protein HflD [Thiohalophilus sp.]|uniref:high frequency lysogenization protein HflD n=1 Tax=Thiohalophilus sp. TaxID=3028392 RepID=UPI0028703ED2|nr:high frequency lysogenization protein HflD [Thiohalophilus sp.]MDR9436071.1 high frequency lysogenization protein HflD [Thiohalophilus sp.]